MLEAAQHDLFREQCDGSQSFVLVTHINPDGDALGSEIGLARFLRARGKDVRIINHDPAPPILEFIFADEPQEVETYDKALHDAVLRDVDRILLVDNSAPDRLGRMEQVMLEEAGHVLCIDHHPSREMPWGLQIVNDRCCATALMIHELVRACGWTPDLPAARAIYTGLATDTGFFRFNSTSPEAHMVAAELLRGGVHSAAIYREIYERNSLAYTRLLGHALADVRLFANGAVAAVKITRELIDRLDAETVDTSEITTALLAMDGIGVTLLFREQRDSRIKVSLRSKGSADVHALAAEFGGGGHRNASGIVADGDIDEVAEIVIARAVALTGQGS